MVKRPVSPHKEKRLIGPVRPVGDVSWEKFEGRRVGKMSSNGATPPHPYPGKPSKTNLVGGESCTEVH